MAQAFVWTLVGAREISGRLLVESAAPSATTDERAFTESADGLACPAAAGSVIERPLMGVAG
jgi:hypothetical protein